MAYKVIETSQAEQDLDNIVSYIVNILGNPSAAAALLNEVEKCFSSLEDMPMLFEACRSPHLRALGYRKAGIRNYIMIYKVNESKKEVIILRFFHGRQDYEKLI